MKLTVRHTVGFLNLVAIELARHANTCADYGAGDIASSLRVTAEKCRAEAKDLNDALKEDHK